MKNYIFHTTYKSKKIKPFNVDTYSSGVDRYWYIMNEKEIKELYYNLYNSETPFRKNSAVFVSWL